MKTADVTRTRLVSLFERPWALLPSTLSRIVEYVSAPATNAPAVLALEGPQGGAARAGSVAVIPVYGVIEHRADWMLELFGGTSVETVREEVRKAYADPSVKAIVLDIDSPGGTAAGIAELAAELRAVRGGPKPIVAVSNTLAASAAYWIASQADEVVVSPSGSVGSIGVRTVHQEMSRMLDEAGITTTLISSGPFKTEANQFEPLTDEARAMLQERSDAFYTMFLGDVAKGRRTTVAKVEADFGGGRLLMARAALDAGMVDRVDTLDATIERVTRSAASGRRTGAEDDLPEAETTEDPATPPFGERVAALAAEAERVAEAAAHRARSRVAASRPPFSTSTERSLRVSRDKLDALLSGEPGVVAVKPGGPAPSTEADEPHPTPVPPAISAEEFRALLKEH
jgi:signal peptide peptidase SppA